MRALKNTATGTSGQSYVKGQFEELGWGTLPNSEHDTGTDLFVMARDDRRFELGALIGIQVKNGTSWFREPVRDDEGRVAGWWFREDDDSHFKYWCDHSVPHAIVLRNPQSSTSYWAHLTWEHVESTGKGSKIFVPEAQRVDADHHDALVDIATSGIDNSTWEGSIWRSGEEIPTPVRLRYALTLPRLVSPHPNRGFKELEAYEAIALLVEFRIDDLERSAKAVAIMKDTALTPPSEIEWEWRLFAALYDWLNEQRIEALNTCVESAENAVQRAAAIACVGFASIEQGETSSVVTMLESELAIDQTSPVDYGWLQVHLACCRVELGELGAACDLAIKVRRLVNEAARDPSARAIVAAASYVLLTASDFGEANVEEVVQDIDTLATWWRSQSLAAGLYRHFEGSFNQWVDDESSIHYMQDLTRNHCRSTMILAGVLADRSSWAHTASMLACRTLMTESDDEQAVTEALNLLRQSGDDRTLLRATAKIRRDGPISALATIGKTLDLDRSTRSTLQTNLRFVELAADVLPAESCDRYVNWMLSVFPEAAELERTLSPEFLVGDAVLSTLAALVPRCSASARRSVMDRLLELPAVADELAAKSFRILIARIPDGEWTHADLDVLGTRNVKADRPEFQNAVEGILAKHRPGVRADLLDKIRVGDFHALANYGDIDDLPSDVVSDTIAILVGGVDEQTSEARRGTYQLGDSDKLGALVLLNLCHPEVAVWPAVESALALADSHPSHLRRAIQVLELHAERVPAEVRVWLRAALQHIVEQPASERDRRPWMRVADVREDAFVTLASLFPDSVDGVSLRRNLAGRNIALRRAAVRVLGAERDARSLTALIALAQDAETSVREAAVGALASWVAHDIAMPESGDVLKAFLAEGGTRFGIKASEALLDGRLELTPDHKLVNMLQAHPSAVVRIRVRHAIGRR